MRRSPEPAHLSIISQMSIHNVCYFYNHVGDYRDTPAYKFIEKYAKHKSSGDEIEFLLRIDIEPDNPIYEDFFTELQDFELSALSTRIEAAIKLGISYMLFTQPCRIEGCKQTKCG